MADNPKSINIIVIAVWVLIGLAIIFSLFDASKLKNVELYVQLVSALAGAAAAIAAFFAVRAANETLKQAREDREAELELKRPRFILTQEFLQLVAEIGDDRSINPFFRLTLIFMNKGKHHAKDIEIEGKLLQENRKVLDFIDNPVREVDGDDSLEIVHDIVQEVITVAVGYVRIRLSYRDGITHKEYSQLIYRKFYGGFGDAYSGKIELKEIDRSEWPEYLETHQRIYQARDQFNRK